MLDLLREVPLQLFGERAAVGDGAVIATARREPGVVGRELSENVPAFDPDRVALVDCCEGDDEESAPERWSVPDPVSFADLEASVESARRALDEQGVGRRHFLFDTLSTQFKLATDPDQVVAHADELAMALGREDGLTIFAVDPATVSEEQHEQLRHLFDVHVEVRKGEDEPELRWTGLVDRSDGWVPFADAGICWDTCGTGLS